jgi:purine-binding chemotaxis protein CheW
MASTENLEKTQHLSFELAGAEYGVAILKVKEILQYEAITRVPSTPRSVRGVINLRGAVVPVVDLAAKFGLPETQVTKRTCILIVEAILDEQPMVVGVLADAVQEVIELSAADVEPPPSFGTQVRVDFLVGMGKVGKRFVLLLDLDRVISADEKEFAQAVRDGVPVEAPAPAAAIAVPFPAPASAPEVTPAA